MLRRCIPVIISSFGVSRSGAVSWRRLESRQRRPHLHPQVIGVVTLVHGREGWHPNGSLP